MKKKVVGIGGTGLIGQQFLRMLSDHPLFEITVISAATNSAGKKLSEIWRLPTFSMPDELSKEKIQDLSKLGTGFDIAFSALPASIAGDLENELRAKGVFVFSNASSHRMDPDVPIIIPEKIKRALNPVM